MIEAALRVVPRGETGKGAARKRRAKGELPAVLYGPARPPQSVAVDAHAAELLFQRVGTGRLIQIQLEGEDFPRSVLIKEAQQDPVRGNLLHLDFYEVPLDRKVSVTVPLRIVGAEERPSDGGILQYGPREISVRCLPTEIPERIDVDVSNLQIGESFTVGELSVPEGVEVLDDPNEVIVSIVLPARAAAAAGVAEAEAEEAGEAEEAAGPAEEEES